MKSFVLSFMLTASLFIYFISLFDAKTNAYIRRFPDSFFIVALIIFLIGYLVAFYWGITDIVKGDRFFNFLGISLSVVGIGFYVLGYAMNTGKGKESPGQFEHDFTAIGPTQQAALQALLQQTNTKEGDVKFVAYWGMYKNDDEFVLCIQQGNVIGLQIKNKKVDDISNISRLKNLNWLVLQNCGLKSIAGLELPKLQRLSINQNALTSLSGFETVPQVSWINYQNNPITDSSALKNHPAKALYIDTE